MGNVLIKATKLVVKCCIVLFSLEREKGGGGGTSRPSALRVSHLSFKACKNLILRSPLDVISSCLAPAFGT